MSPLREMLEKVLGSLPGEPGSGLLLDTHRLSDSPGRDPCGDRYTSKAHPRLLLNRGRGPGLDESVPKDVSRTFPFLTDDFDTL